MREIELAEHPEVFRGCAGCGRRMSEELLDLFRSSPRFLRRALCPSGVRLEFATDSSELEFSLVFGEAVRPVFTSDIVIAGEKIIPCDGPGPHRVSLPAGEKEIVIHLPHLATVEKLGLKLADHADFRSLPLRRKRLLFCGDSILQGMVTTSPAGAPAARTAAALNMDFINTSVGGARMNAEHLRLTAAAGGDILILALGVNDAILKTDFDLFRRNTEETLKILSGFSGWKYLILPIPNLAPSTPDLEVYRSILRECADICPEIEVLDGYEFFPAKPELYFDLTHPNNAGAQVYAACLAETIQKKGLL